MTSESKSTRPDGRQDGQIRAPETVQGLLSRADGSMQYSQAKTSVLVAVNGPLPVRAKEEKIDRAVVEVVFKSAAGAASNYDTDRGEVIRQALESVIMTSLHPCTKISVVIQVFRDDGSLLATCLNAACLALLDAGIQCNSMLSAICIATTGDGARYLMDPTLYEEKTAESVVTVAFTSTSDGVAVSETRGVLSDESYLACVDYGRKASATVQAFFRMALAKKA